MALLQIPNCRNQCINIFTRVVDSEGRAHRAFDAEAPKNRLCAVVPRADGDALTVESRSHIFRAKSIQNEGKYAGFFASRADQPKPGDALQSFRGIHQKIVLIARDVHHADAFEIVDRGAQSNGIRDVSRTGFKAAGRRLVSGFSNVTS